ncbi:hypothetical protein JCM5350_000075 [Sporobolomyces pararoseus]
MNTSGEGSTPAQAKPVDIPFDLWLMIGEHLEPLDLVHLTRVNKSLRRLLRSKSDSARVWKLAFKNVNLPTLKATDWDLVHLASFIGEQRPCLGCGLVDGHRSWDRSVEREFATLIFVHWYCLSNVYARLPTLANPSQADVTSSLSSSTASEISDIVGVLHSDTLSCVPSWSNPEDRESEQYYIPSQVKAMNDYLHHLDSTTTASRDRQMRKAAREARDEFIASKKRCVKARIEDARKLEKWIDGYEFDQRKAADRRWKQELQMERERDDRIQTRLWSIRARLVSLGHEEKDLEWLGDCSKVMKDQELTEPEWNEVVPELNQLAEAQKTKREQDELATFEASLLSTYYDYFDKRCKLSLFCSKVEFGKLPSAKQLVAARSTVGDSLWNELLPSLRSRFDKSRRKTKLSYARPLAHALDDTGHPLSPTLCSSLFPPRGASLTKLNNYWKVPRKIDLDSKDTSTISEAELDTFFSRFTSRVFCGHFDKHRTGTFSNVATLRQIHPHLSGVSVSIQLIKILFWILEVTGIEDGEEKETIAKLDGLGKVWSCKSEDCSNGNPPLVTLSELLQHLSDKANHARALNPHYSQGSYHVSSIVYTPQVAVAGSSSTT